MRFICKNIFNKIEETDTFQSIRNGLVMAIPVLMMGSFSLLFKTLPILQYQQFIQNFQSGILIELFSIIHQATFGLLSLYMVVTISICLNRIKDIKDATIGSCLTSLICFAIMSGIFIMEPKSVLDNFGVNGMFIAIFISISASDLYFFVKEKLDNKFRLFTEGTDMVFNDTVSAIAPSLFVVLCFTTCNLIFVDFFHVTSFSSFISELINKIFFHMGCSFKSAILFVLTSSILWFFGIHGSDALDGVNKSLFEPAIQENIKHLMMGQPATEIFSKTFFDIFVLMGGCGSCLCLLVAIFLFSKRKRNKDLARIAAFPMIFNINELMIFGLPVAFNSLLFIPFILTPIVSLIIGYVSMKTGLVPVPTVQVEWTTPILLGGYMATGSIRGSVLQLINIAVGTLIYRPFICAYDREILEDGYKSFDSLVAMFKKSEGSNRVVTLTETRDSAGTVARILAAYLKSSIDNKKVYMYYQPQHNNEGECIGAEALLRWKHPVFGIIYPPLVIKLAEEMQILEELEECIFETVACDIERINKETGIQYTISINVSAQTIQKPSFLIFLREFTKTCSIKKNQICIEITEQDTIMLNDNLHQTLAEIHQMGYLLAIDDFSMGATSIKYLQNNRFDLVKLDGSLVKQIDTNSRSRNIVASIVYLADSLGFSVLAEYVENKENQVQLEHLGCLQYQGYLYSPAVPVENFIDYLKK